MCGGGLPKLPLGLDQWLYAIPYGVLGFLALLPLIGPIGTPYPWWIWIGPILSYMGAFLGKRTGHGQWMDLGSFTGIIKPERLDFINRLFFGRDINETLVVKGNYWRDFIGLSISGLAVSLIASICLIIGGHIVAGLLVALGGFLKGFAYMIGWSVNGDSRTEFLGEHLDEATELGEFLTGFFGGFPMFYCIIILLLEFI